MSLAEDNVWMGRALDLARRGLYTADPNPRVGCVIVKDGEMIGEGWHARAGEPHAEIHALAAAGTRARGATAYVSLEPCRHHGRTGPCTVALIEAGVQRVVAAMRDPNPRMAGRGLADLARAGVRVDDGVLAPEAEALNAGFVSRHRRGRPLVRVKIAASLDGRTAMASGESRWITGAAARRDVQRLRAASSAVLTGIGTVLADDPLLTVRDERFGPSPRQPLRVVLDSDLRTPPAARLLEAPGRTLVVAARASERAAALRAAGAEVLVLDDGAARVDAQALLAALAAREVNEILVEAGATLAGALLGQGLADELVVYLAPVLLGCRARGMVALPAIERLAEGIGLEVVETVAIGDDLRITALPRDGAADGGGEPARAEVP
ncbi:MAG: bifunctional diaminohydroxyphosphoribosylaminopyrimidine deaminase/5-amino-6-(5-phosphoribosylamino)uracil reductase RibD [Gammaproteobacteria bacterium]|nr:bifunctional diaminohydroxyphosphoribosylaminopyrimidine deaminase/5-amino-6-(5-phosphoribosylamino)uracil reductase RibD [Gammaproteobacteria bacterium]